MTVWIPKNQEEANKRHAGRRKLHIRLRKERAERIRELLSDMLGGDASGAEMLRQGEYGATTRAAMGFGVSLATASRDLALCRRMLAEFQGLFEREFDPGYDEVAWTWDYARYGFRAGNAYAPPSKRKPPVEGSFPFTTRGEK